MFFYFVSLCLQVFSQHNLVLSLHLLISHLNPLFDYRLDTKLHSRLFCLTDLYYWLYYNTRYGLGNSILEIFFPNTFFRMNQVLGGSWKWTEQVFQLRKCKYVQSGNGFTKSSFEKKRTSRFVLRKSTLTAIH